MQTPSVILPVQCVKALVIEMSPRVEFVHTATGVTVVSVLVLMLLRLSETSQPLQSRTDRMVAQILDLADQYHGDARASDDDLDRFRLRAMSLSLLKYASIAHAPAQLELVAGYNVGRRAKHVEQQLAQLRQTLSPAAQTTPSAPPAVPNA